ncbi:replication initiation protein [Alkaliphilus metalliredigens]|uniref:replication initiation protein n=1 Tax=Alkaliphilus metalliredigens TaxID=208226 RepID=UPI00030A193D|nr:replication initiation protein [Alkaliphilus metalliredigens]
MTATEEDEFKKSNDLSEWMATKILLKNPFTVMELKLFTCVLSMIRKDDDLKEYEISISQFMKMPGTTSKNVYDQIQQAGERLMQKIVTIQRGDRRIRVALMSSVETKMGGGTVKVSFDPKIKPELITLQEKYTEYTLGNIMALRSTHTIRLYELFKQCLPDGERTLTVDEIKSHLTIAPDSYKRTNDLKEKVVDKSLEEIGELTDIVVNIKHANREGRKIIGWTFVIGSNKNADNSFS